MNTFTGYISYDEEKNICCLSKESDDYLNWLPISPSSFDENDLQRIKDIGGLYVDVLIEF